MTSLRSLRKHRRYTPIELRDIEVIQELEVSQTSFDQLWILNKQIDLYD
jgi:hypothetical protein